MPIKSAAIGSRYSAITTNMTPRRLLAFAAGIGVSSPRVFDDLNEGFCAVPQICVSPEYHLAVQNRLGNNFGTTAEERRRAVHAVQDSEFLRPIKSGNQLTTTAEVVGLWTGRSGANVGVAIKHSVDGEPVCRTYMQGTYRDVALDGEGMQPKSKPVVPSPGSSVQEHEPLSIHISRELPHVFSECADIWNPIHTERAVALAAGLPDIILHGVATWSIAGRELVDFFAGGDVSALKRLRGRMGAMVIPGTTLTLRAQSEVVERTRRVFYTIETEQGDAAIRDGYAVFGEPL